MTLTSEHLHILGLSKIINLCPCFHSDFWSFLHKRENFALFFHLTRAILVMFFGSILKSMPFSTTLDPKGCIQMNLGKIDGISHSKLGKICLRSADDYTFSSHFLPISGQTWLFLLIFWKLQISKPTFELFKKELNYCACWSG